ncbi:MAG TPA: ABC transporter permease subunit [Patescibacteria group bacterium]|nr:ABC transporter permease subunit [Patescibacteria group bacterium]
MKAVFWRILKDRQSVFLVYILVNIGLLLMYISLFPSFKDQSAAMEQLFKSYPESFLKAFNFDIANFTTIEGFLSTEQFSFMWPLLVVLMSVGFAGTAFAGEIEKGTIEILLAQPISRLKLFISRYLAGLASLVVFVIFSVFIAIPIIEIFKISYTFENFATMALLAFLFGLVIYSIGMFLSAIFSDKGKVYFISGALLVVMYVLNIVSSIKEQLADLKYVSFFYYFNPSKALIHNQIDHWGYLVFIGISAVVIVIGAAWFSKRDIMVS